ncbi:Fc receptor-like protein 5 isoform X2 [Amphiprion ocellaris]|uniref:Ig-like domain-containing protein n=1 Tax=Amphiprion ocellaris TaxID=80972 RepID=A0AAQ5ZE70_AMPOC|nr:Fc receptor-like protein 5 isoform X2 [Amphiprion ocellaris]
MFASVFVVILGLFYCSKESSQSFLGRPQLYGPSEALAKKAVEFECEVLDYPEDELILLQLFKVGDHNWLLGESTSLDGEVAVIPMIIKTSHEGYLECVASAQNNSEITPTVSHPHYLKVVEPVEGAEIIHSGPVELYEGNPLKLRCELSAGTHVSYKWLLNGQPVSQSPVRYVADDRLMIYRTSSGDSGSYVCVATNTFNKTRVFSSNSSKVVFTVKDLVSNPSITFTVLKEDSQNYSAVVTCESTRGTPPITFSLYNRTELVSNMTTDDRQATFKVPLVLDRHLGWLQCQANNSDRIAYSDWLPLEVVPVGGPVTMHYDFDLGENYAIVSLRFYCKVKKGSHPRYQWFLNKTLLQDRGSFYYVANEPPKQSILLLSVGRSSTGTYRCEVSDSFDNTTAISSKKHYLDKDVLNRLPILLVAVVFGCFTTLILLVSICCCIGVMFRRRQYGEKSLLNLEMERMTVAYEGDLDLSMYNEDPDVVNTARGDEFDQTSEASLDEWLHIEEEKTTLEDEHV